MGITNMKNKLTKVDINYTIITHADLLAQRHQDYVSEFVTRANSELYAILAEILKLHEMITACAKSERVVKQMRRSLKDNFNIKTQANTKTTALVVKYVTRASRKTAHVYGKVLDVAIADGITSDGLVEYIKSKGGIDKVRKAVVSAETAREQAQQQTALEQALSKHLANLAKPLATLTLPKEGYAQFPGAMDVEFYNLLCNFNLKTNQYEIVAVMYPNCTFERQAMDNYLLMLGVAASSDTNEFYHLCKQFGLNMDLIHRWMKANKIADAASARALAKALGKVAAISQKPNQLKLAA
jgi:hypothetical protein